MRVINNKDGTWDWIHEQLYTNKKKSRKCDPSQST